MNARVGLDLVIDRDEILLNRIRMVHYSWFVFVATLPALGFVSSLSPSLIETIPLALCFIIGFIAAFSCLIILPEVIGTKLGP